MKARKVTLGLIGLALLSPPAIACPGPDGKPPVYEQGVAYRVSPIIDLFGCADGLDTDSLLAGKAIKLRQSLTDKNSQDKAATVQWVHPEGQSTSFNTDATLGATLLRGFLDPPKGQSGHNWSLDLTGEFHKNTLTDKKKDTSGAGLSWTGDYFNVPMVNRQTGEPEGRSTSHLPTAFLTYKNDREKAGRGVMGGFGYSYINQRYLLGIPADFNIAQIYWLPAIALQGEYADGLQAAAGSTYRVKPSVTVGIYPFGVALDQRVSLTGSYQSWYNFSRNGPFNDYDRYQDLAVYSVEVNFVRSPAIKSGDSNVALALEYHKGENPEQGQAKQAFTQLTLKLKL